MVEHLYDVYTCMTCTYSVATNKEHTSISTLTRSSCNIKWTRRWVQMRSMWFSTLSEKRFVYLRRPLRVYVPSLDRALIGRGGVGWQRVRHLLSRYILYCLVPSARRLWAVLGWLMESKWWEAVANARAASWKRLKKVAYMTVAFGKVRVESVTYTSRKNRSIGNPIP